MPRSERARALLLGAIAFSWFAFHGLRHAAAVPAVGDEPDYLLIAQSLWRDFDLNTDDNYARGDYEGYAPGLARAPGLVRRADGGGAAVHSAGLPALIAPVFAAGEAIGGGAAGRTACVVLMALLAALLAELCRSLALRFSSDETIGLFVWAATLGLPTLGLAISIYPEIPAALAIALAMRWIVPGASVMAAFGAAIALAALPWLHARVAGASMALGVLALVRLSGTARVAFAATAGAMAALYFAVFRAVYGVSTPWDVYRGAMNRGTPELAAPGLLLDPSYGLLPYAPVFLLALAGVVPLLSARNADRWAHAGAIAALVGPVLMFRKWWGGYCPPARFLVPLLPLLAIALAARLSSRQEDGRAFGLARFRWALLGASLAIALAAIAVPADKLLLNGRDEEPRLWAESPGDPGMARYLPKLSSRAGSMAPPWRPPLADRELAIVWSVALVALLATDALSRRRARLARAYPIVVAAVIVAIVASVDLVLRRDAPPPVVLPAESEVDDVAGGA